MKVQKRYAKVMEEAKELRHHTSQMCNGNLDMNVDVDGFEYLKEIAEDVNQINNTFNTYINEITHILSHLSAGNMSVAFSNDVHYHGDFLPIKNALHKIKHSLNCSFEEIHNLSLEIDAMSTQVEYGSSLLATNATEQAALISDLTSTIYDITDKTVLNAENAQTAAKKIEAIARETEIGKSYIYQMLTSVDKVMTSINNISNILELINGIALQTKLLAVNAQIEAARAGGQGHGFSVVASEISKLAQRSSEAANQTSDIILNSIAAAEESAKIIRKTAESFKNINDSIEGMAGLCKEIAEVSDIQAENLKETSAIITNISEVVQTNAAYAQENSAGAANLSNISYQLKNVLQRFRLMGQEKIQEIDNDMEKEYIRQLIGSLVPKLVLATATDHLDSILEREIQNHSDVECLYVIDGKGIQISHTIMNQNAMLVQDENFKPALPGEDYSSKKYYRQAMKNRQELHTSSEYISKATGNLCRTFSYAYQGIDKEHYVICIDMLCRF